MRNHPDLPADAPQWLRDADVEQPVWRDGEWRDGEWRDGVWRGGVWRDGEWRSGEWHGGEWHGADLLDCDGEKARIRGGTFTRIATPWMPK